MLVQTRHAQFKSVKYLLSGLEILVVAKARVSAAANKAKYIGQPK